jgi:N-acetyl sugar amidotransferase
MLNKNKPYQICLKTVMDTTDPGISFDSDGISNHYWDFQRVVKPNWNPSEAGRKSLALQVEAIKEAGKNSDFDCLLGLSGGLDSSYMLHIAVKELGLRPLVFHVDGGWNSEIAVHNIEALVSKLGLDLYTEVINWNEMRDFQLAWLKSGVPHIDIPQDHAFISVLYKFAEKHGIKAILNGGNISTECVAMPFQYYYWGTDITHIQDIIARFSTIPMDSYPFSSVYRHKIFLRYIKGIKVYKPLNYLPFDKISAIELLVKKYGWKPYPQKHFESRFTKFLESYWLPTRFGFDVRRCQLSSLILTGQLTRDEALNELLKPAYDKKYLNEDFEYIASKLDITISELRLLHDMPKRFYSDYKNQQWMLGFIEKLVSTLKIARRGGAF